MGMEGANAHGPNRKILPCRMSSHQLFLHPKKGRAHSSLYYINVPSGTFRQRRKQKVYFPWWTPLPSLGITIVTQRIPIGYLGSAGYQYTCGRSPQTSIKIEIITCNPTEGNIPFTPCAWSHGTILCGIQICSEEDWERVATPESGRNSCMTSVAAYP